ncbi:MAG: hypothetical protein J6K76_07400 [Spirochaetaceae bacterium]|nr:hypothetical protein [Spirochaetaceae bacterium]
MGFNFGKYVSLPFFLILFLLSSCSNVLVQENSGDIEVSLVVPEDSGRLASQRSVNATISLTHHVEGWIENQQGERLQTVKQDFSGSTVLSFKQVEPETVVRVFVRISDKSGVLYSGKSDFFTVERRGNQVSVKLDNGDFPTGDVSPEDTETAGVNEPVAGEGNSPAASAFDPSWITVTVVSRNGTPNTVTASGSADGTSVTHNFYGIEGSQVQFSLSQEAIDAGMSLYINDGKTVGYASTKFYQESGTVQYAVQIQRSGETSSWYYFNVTSKMKPVTVTFTNLHYVYSSANNANATINIYNSFTIGNQSVEGTIYKEAYYSTEPTEKLKEKDFNVKVEFTSPTDTVTVAPSTNGATVSINNGSPSPVESQNFSLKESLWGKTSVMWGKYLQLTYSISQQ